LLSFPEEKRELAVIPWQEQPLAAVVNPRHKLAGETAISVQRLQDEAFVAFTPELTIRKRIDKWLQKQHVTVDVVQEFDNIGQIK
jgi:DNA-binding transcriptional LysR family regulator